MKQVAMKQVAVLAVALIAGLASPAMAQQQQQGVLGPTVTMRGAIESIERETKTVLVKGSDGRITMMRVDGSVPNFAKLEKGNKVTARYTEAMLLSIAPIELRAQPSTNDESSGQETEQTPASLPPIEPSRMMAKVTDVDHGASKLTLQAPKGEEIRMNVRDKRVLSDVKKGDEVVATYIDALALSIDPDDDS